jgi:hypothetical protein
LGARLRAEEEEEEGRMGGVVLLAPIHLGNAPVFAALRSEGRDVFTPRLHGGRLDRGGVRC